MKTEMFKRRVFFMVFLFVVSARFTHAQNSAPSSHMVFNDRFDGDIIINQVRVPKHGEAMYTYYETLGWGGIGSGYCGLQAHPRARNFIFSIWDNKKHTGPIKAVFHGPGTETKKFGGEGTGLKSWNFKLGWSTDVWYTFAARNWPVGDHTHYALWVRAGDTKKWTHLITMDVAAKGGRFRGGTDAFLEDWVNSGKNQRTTHLRGGWKRKMDGTWFPFSQGRYSVNAWDLVKGKRSFNFRTNWDGGISKDKTGPFYYMVAGGATTKPKSENPSTHAIKRSKTKPDFPTIAISKLNVEMKEKSLVVTWKNDQTSLPQFAYQVQVFTDRIGAGKAVLVKAGKIAHGRSVTLDGSSLNLRGRTYYVHLKCTDILGGESKVKVAAIGIPAK